VGDVVLVRDGPSIRKYTSRDVVAVAVLVLDDDDDDEDVLLLLGLTNATKG
jgi:hypothetical protein